MQGRLSRSPIRSLMLLSCVAVTAAVAPAAGQSGSRQSAEVRFVEQRPGVPTALTFKIDYVNPDDPNAKPHAVRTVTETLAAGAHYDTSVPAECTASDAALIVEGSSACPHGEPRRQRLHPYRHRPSRAEPLLRRRRHLLQQQEPADLPQHRAPDGHAGRRAGHDRRQRADDHGPATTRDPTRRRRARRCRHET